MTDDERLLLADMAHALDRAAAQCIEMGLPFAAYRGFLSRADSLMDRALS